ncbi:hypothetical protein IIC65_03265, partial [Candidatus Sumerlaeota bacterium]|nr:hypothetical protein [Candidatus Sumerlaeota bacterium]
MNPTSTPTPDTARWSFGSSRIALGALVALLPWVSWPQWPTHEPLVDLKWPVAAWGLSLVVALSFFERARALAPRDLLSASWMPLFLGAFLIAAGLALSSSLSPAPLLSWRISLREMMFISVACRLAMLRTPARVSLAVLGAYMCSAALQAAWTLWQWTGRGGEAGGRGAMIGTLGNPEYAANWMAPALALAIIWLGTAGVRPLWRGALLLVVGLVGSSIFLSGGRGAAVGVVVSIAIVAAMRRRRKASARESRGGDPERASTKADSRLPAEALAKPRPGLLGLAGRGLG